jgi:chemotaxis protein CheD
MYSHYNHRLKSTVEILHPGEFRATKEDVVLSTVLGSCVSVVLTDAVGKIGGMNHFMLPGPAKHDSLFTTESGRYGLQAMELLINNMMKVGARRDRLRAKVFGGSYVLNSKTRGGSTIPDDNVEFAFAFLKLEEIPVDSYDVGGDRPRKLYVYPASGKVLLYRLRNMGAEQIKAREEAYRKSLEEAKKSWGDFIKF